MNRRRFTEAIVVLLNLFTAQSLADDEDSRGVADDHDVAVIRASRLECMIGNNKSHLGQFGQHRAGYNGVFWLKSPDQPETPFVPAYAGLNLEHYFDARKEYQGRDFFEPRHATMKLKQLGAKSVELYQPPTATFGVESWTRFETVDPYYLDFSFRCIPRRDEFQGNFMGAFWASYIHGPIDKSTYFLDADSTLNEPVWRQFCTQRHNRDSTVRSKSDMAQTIFAQSDQTLFSSMSPLRYSEPFFYGRFRNMVLIYVFEPNPHLRFSHSPSGGGANAQGDDTNPAWDFQLVIPDYQINKEYRLRGRLIYKLWQDRNDVLAEVGKYLNR